MRSDYREFQEEKKKLKTRFTILYAGSIALLLLAFGAYWYFFSPSGEPVYTAMISEQAENNALLNEDRLLHESLIKLDDLDLSYSKMLVHSADSVALDSLSNVINVAEKDFSNLIERTYKHRSLYKNPANVTKSDSIIHAFISALDYRKSNNSLRMAFAGNGNFFEGDTLAMLQLQMEVKSKKDTIKNLQEQLKYQSQFYTNSFPVQKQSFATTEIESLQENIKTQADSIENLLELYSSVAKANRNLTSQLNKLQTQSPQNTTNSVEASFVPEKINTLNARIDDLNAELALAQIDCNLTRANGKDIIYNSRQRKDLLQESLRSLKNLSGSTNPIIQRKVKDKMELLQTIANTVRD